MNIIVNCKTGFILFLEMARSGGCDVCRL